MPHRNILVLLDNTVSELVAKISRTKNVTFIPADSDQKLTITFTGRVPFSDWETSSQTGAAGKNLKGKVLDVATGSYPYTAKSDPGSESVGQVANPELIVDGGLVPPNAGPRK